MRILALTEEVITTIRTITPAIATTTIPLIGTTTSDFAQYSNIIRDYIFQEIYTVKY